MAAEVLVIVPWSVPAGSESWSSWRLEPGATAQPPQGPRARRGGRWDVLVSAHVRRDARPSRAG